VKWGGPSPAHEVTPTPVKVRALPSEGASEPPTSPSILTISTISKFSEMARKLTAAAKATSHKRQASTTTTSPSTTKRVKRQSTSKSASKKRAIQEDIDPDMDVDMDEPSEGGDDDASEFSGEPSSNTASSNDDAELSEFSEHENKSDSRRQTQPRNAKARARGGKAQSESKSAKDLVRPGKTGVAPGTQVWIKKSKTRNPGDTPYEDHTVHSNTMEFLRDLAANNNREWLKCEYQNMFSFIPACRCSSGLSLHPWSNLSGSYLRSSESQPACSAACTRLQEEARVMSVRRCSPRVQPRDGSESPRPVKSGQSIKRRQHLHLGAIGTPDSLLIMSRITAHDTDYRTSQKDWASFVESLTQKIVELDETIPELPVKDVVSNATPTRSRLVGFGRVSVVARHAHGP
jgi:Conserved hypothetical protein (DUF2461)